MVCAGSAKCRQRAGVPPGMVQDRAALALPVGIRWSPGSSRDSNSASATRRRRKEPAAIAAASLTRFLPAGSSI
jgi:hypothetical protein